MTDAELRKLFLSTKTIAVVGLSSDPSRPSHGVAEYLQAQGFRIIPVNPNETEILGERCYPDLRSVPEAADAVLVFRRPEFAIALAEQAIAKGAKVFWMQDGAGNAEAAARAEQAGLIVVIDDCMMRQHGRLFSRS